MSRLTPCSECQRHVRRADRVCPFCRAAIADPVPDRPLPTARLGRAATFAFGAASLASAAGCSASPVPAPVDAPTGRDSPAITIDTGGMASDTGPIEPDTGGPVDAGVDAGGVAPPYGLPPEDAGPLDGGGTGNLYGAPPSP